MKLNKEQNDFVNIEENCIAIAGPGSGKTHTLKTKIVNLIKKQPKLYKNILVLTFTNAAANEIKDRIIKELIKENIEYNNKEFWIGTFHSIFYKLMLQYNLFELINMENHSFIMQDDIKRILTRELKIFIEDNNTQLVEEAKYTYCKIYKKKKTNFTNTVLEKVIFNPYLFIKEINSLI